MFQQDIYKRTHTCYLPENKVEEAKYNMNDDIVIDYLQANGFDVTCPYDIVAPINDGGRIFIQQAFYFLRKD